MQLKQEGEGELKVNDEWTVDFKGWWKSRDGKKEVLPLNRKGCQESVHLGGDTIGKWERRDGEASHDRSI